MNRPTFPASLTGFLAATRVQLALVTAFSVVVIFSKLGGHGLANYDDCFYAQKAKEILQTGDWMTMHYKGLPAWENAPLFMWLLALSYKLFGVSEFAAKFPSALFGVGTIVLVWYFAKYLYDGTTAFLSATVLATTFLFTRYARRAMMDVTLSFFVTLALFALLLAVRKDARWFFVWALCTSASILIKSILGFFPFVIGVGFLLATRRWRVLFTPAFLGSLLIIVALGGAWYFNQILAYGRPFIDAHFGWLIIYRGITMESQAWYEHLSYVEDLFTYYWPWIPLLCIGMWNFSRKSMKSEEALLLMLWIAAYLVIMSLMKSRKVWYVMPIVPAAAMVVGSTLGGYLTERAKRAWVLAFAALTVVAAVVMLLTPVQVESERESDVREISPYVKHFASQGAAVIGFREDYYGLNNALLFYSDYPGFPIFDRYDSVAARFQSDATVMCVLEKEELAGMQEHVPGVRVVKETGGKTLIANKELVLPW
jgi:4-amino-4-deoxy-L-arabinose transferase-like glycosyltransferase